MNMPKRHEVWMVPGDETSWCRVVSLTGDSRVLALKFGSIGAFVFQPGEWDKFLHRGAVRIWPPEKKYEQALEQAAAVLQAALPIGQVKHIGLLEVPVGVEELFHQNALLATTVGVAKSVLDDIRESVERARRLVIDSCLHEASQELAEVLEMFDLIGEAADDDVGDGG